MKIVVLYARVSSEQQTQKATIASQIASLTQRVEIDGHHVTPDDIFVDDGYSGSTLTRPGLERLRDRVAEGRVDLVYVHSPDRLARRYAYQVLLLDEFASHGVEVVFLTNPPGSGPEDSLLVQVQGIIAEYERTKIMERCRRGKLHHARSGSVNPMSGAPYGYKYVRKTDSERARYELIEHEATTVRRIFDFFVHEQKSIGEIVRVLTREKIEKRRGGSTWDRSTVWGILRNPAYKGHAAYGKTEATERTPPLRAIRSRAFEPATSKEHIS